MRDQELQLSLIYIAEVATQIFVHYQSHVDNRCKRSLYINNYDRSRVPFVLHIALFVEGVWALEVFILKAGLPSPPYQLHH